MNNDITIQNDYQGLVEEWLKAESEGERFPVPFDVAWQMAGYSRKDSAKRALKTYLTEKDDFCLHKVWKRRNGKGSEDFRLTCDGLKECR